MVDLSGLGVWIWECHACERGDPAAIAAKAKRAGIEWVVVKVGEDTPNGQVTLALVEGLRTGGVECGVWWYCRPRSFDTQIAMLKDAQERANVRHFVMDAEVEWDSPDQRAVAAQFAQRLRAALGDDAYLADAPWARPVAHRAPFPYAEFGAVMNARHPQFYFKLAEDGGETFAPFLADCDLEWAQTAPRSVICPALSTVSYDGTRHSPVAELAAALDRYDARPARSIWSWQHMNGDEWTLLEQRANVPIADPLAGVPVPGLQIPGENA